MSTIRRFEEIEAWQTARELTRRIYLLSGRGELARDFGLKDQMRRAAVSVMSNIAEGYESQTLPMFRSFLSRAKGSAGELRAQLYVVEDAGYLSPSQVAELRNLAEKCSAQISRFIAYLNKRQSSFRVTEDQEPYLEYRSNR